LSPRPHMAVRAFTRARKTVRRRTTAVPECGVSHSTVASAREETRMSQHASLADDEGISAIYLALPPGKRSQTQMATFQRGEDEGDRDTAPHDTTAAGNKRARPALVAARASLRHSEAEPPGGGDDLWLDGDNGGPEPVTVHSSR